MNKEELFKKYQEIILKTNGGVDDYVVALYQISNLLKDYAEEKDGEIAKLKSDYDLLDKTYKGTCATFQDDHNALINLLKFNTKQVCDKMIDSLLDISHRYWRFFKNNGVAYMTDEDLTQILDEIRYQLERGEL